MEMCSDGHDEVVFDYSCPACDLIRKMNKCPNCRKSKVITESDIEGENKRLSLVIFDLETKLIIEKRKNQKGK